MLQWQQRKLQWQQRMLQLAVYIWQDSAKLL
jgi:hypothetical protein